MIFQPNGFQRLVHFIQIIFFDFCLKTFFCITFAKRLGASTKIEQKKQNCEINNCFAKIQENGHTLAITSKISK